MSVRHALLALLSAGPATTYQLRKDFDLATGAVWPLNIGQASATLARLERDGMIRREDNPGASADGGTATAGDWHLSAAGREELAAWWGSAVPRSEPERHELVMKLALAVTVPGVDVPSLLQTQRSASLSALHEVTRARRSVPPEDLAAALVLDHHIFAIEAEIRWIDDVEGTLARAGRPAASRAASEVSPTAARAGAQR
ncbi:PadR family transcriptional regulator [Brachybacterium sp. JHP9]|uniref:PadR family transcriptional regulator n=1 Tax=Brachybacterium equifaecis TaxID=2910770 RepID=A0ABT0R0U7_9MICO|nr:PadR family transcriptional regulator [Brachybacterium equifaecis]MCL6423540.1 PadR family transcriptional regulator [Brachybacterium equifaecis]